MATGEYIFFADQDDVWCEDKVEEMTKVMEEHKNIMLLCSDFEPLVSSKDAPKLSQKVLNSMLDDGTLEEIVLNRKNIFIGSLGCVMCVRKTFPDGHMMNMFGSCLSVLMDVIAIIKCL